MRNQLIMKELGRIPVYIKTGDESLINTDKRSSYKLLDFWRWWSASDILSNATRSRFAEFIVATATQVNLSKPRDEWHSYDLLTSDNIKIEVKSAAFIQSWYQKELSKISFSISTARGWDNEMGIQSAILQRHADVYVMCLLKHCDVKEFRKQMCTLDIRPRKMAR